MNHYSIVSGMLLSKCKADNAPTLFAGKKITCPHCRDRLVNKVESELLSLREAGTDQEISFHQGNIETFREVLAQ